MMTRVKKAMPVSLLFISTGILLLLGYISTQRQLTGMEAYGFQLFALFVGFGGSYVFGRQGTITGPHARSAFRRLVSLYRSISHVANIIADDGPEDDGTKMKIVKELIIEQINTADDALEDWQDIVPESVEELRQEPKNGN